MNRRSVLNHFGLLPLVFVPVIGAAKNEIVLGLKSRWERSKEYTIAVLDAMPEESLEFSPSEDQISFAQQLIHLGFWNNFYMGFMMDQAGYAKGNPFKQKYIINLPDEIDIYKLSSLNKRSDKENKEVVRKYLVETFDYSIEQIGKMKDKDLAKGKEKSKPWFLEGHSNLDMILRGENHTAHHRAQAIAYLRMKGAPPPSYGDFNTLPA